MVGARCKFIPSSRILDAARSVKERKSVAVCMYRFNVFGLKGGLKGSLDIVLGNSHGVCQHYPSGYLINKDLLFC